MKIGGAGFAAGEKVRLIVDDLVQLGPDQKDHFLSNVETVDASIGTSPRLPEEIEKTKTVLDAASQTEEGLLPAQEAQASKGEAKISSIQTKAKN